MTVRKIRVGIIGTGFGTKVHVPIFNSHQGFEVVAMASVTQRKKQEELREETGIHNIYMDWRAMFEKEQLDLVSIVSSPLNHYEMVVYALMHGVHVLCEKPMAMNQQQSNEMLAIRDKANRLGFINFEWRFLPGRMAVKEVITSGKLGRIMHIRYSGFRPTYQSLITSKQGWLSKKESGGGMLNAIGTHLFDSLLWWIGHEIDTIHGQLSTYHPEVIDGEGNVESRTSDQAFRSIGTFANGTTFSTEYLSGIRHKKEDWRLEVFGTEGTMVLTDDQNVELALGNNDFEKIFIQDDLVVPEGIPSDVKRFYTPFISLVDRIYNAVSGEGFDPDLPLFENGHKVQKIIDAIHKSSQEGIRVSLNN